MIFFSENTSRIHLNFIIALRNSLHEFGSVLIDISLVNFEQARHKKGNSEGNKPENENRMWWIVNNLVYHG